MTEEIVSKGKWILTVDWCKQGYRGLFSDREGNVYWSDVALHTEDEIFEILGMFDLVLDPKSEFVPEEDFPKYHIFIPLGEYCDQYGYVLKDEDFERMKKEREAKNECKKS